MESFDNIHENTETRSTKEVVFVEAITIAEFSAELEKNGCSGEQKEFILRYCNSIALEVLKNGFEKFVSYTAEISQEEGGISIRPSVKTKSSNKKSGLSFYSYLAKKIAAPVIYENIALLKQDAEKYKRIQEIMNEKKIILVFNGVSGSGKTTVIGDLHDTLPHTSEKVITYASRSPRKSEADGVDYHFRPDSFFEDNKQLYLVNFKEDRGYKATNRFDIETTEKRVIICTYGPKGVAELVKENYKVVLVYLPITDSVRESRMKARGSNAEEIRQRIENDTDDYVLLKEIIPGKQILILDSDMTIDDKVSRIVEYLENIR